MSWRDLGRFGVVLVVSLVATALALALLWWSVDVLLAVFAGVLLGLFLGGLADWVSRRTPLALYLAVQTVESYLLTPLIQQRTVWLPPALTISAQVLLTVTLGWLALLLATPLTAAVVVLVKMLYVQSVLREPVEVIASAEDRAA